MLFTYSSNAAETPSAHSSGGASGSCRTAKRKSTSDSDGGDACYICLDNSGHLTAPCACPRLVHASCLARWQLQQAGRREERFCRFCSSELPDWKSTLAGPRAPPQVQPVMVVSLGSKVQRIAVKPGPDGMREFQQRIRALFDIPDGVDFEVTFRCKAPVEHTQGVPADTIQLEGMSSYEAAAHCASLMAAQRVASTGTAAGSPSADLPLAR